MDEEDYELLCRKIEALAKLLLPDFRGRRVSGKACYGGAPVEGEVVGVDCQCLLVRSGIESPVLVLLEDIRVCD